MGQSLTETIADDLRGRMAAGTGLPASLSLGALASHYGVSLTPIRLAILELIREGWIEKLPTGRLQVAAKARDGAHTEVETSPDRTVNLSPLQVGGWDERLVPEILMKSLLGHTGYLREEAIAQRFGVGRTMVRQAFNRLAGKGLLTHVPRCGWQIRSFDDADMRAYLVAREAIELTALDLARDNLVQADLERMLESNSSPGPSEERLDNDLHRYLLEKSGNHYLQEFFDRHGLYYTFLFDYAAPEAHVIDEMAAQHREILQALICKDWPTAKLALQRHIRAQQPVVGALMSGIGNGKGNRE